MMPKVEKWDLPITGTFVCRNEDRLAQLRWIKEKLMDVETPYRTVLKAIDKELN